MEILSGTSTEWLFVHCFQVELELGNVGFVEGGKPEYPEKNPRSRNENQQQTQPTYYDAETGNRTRATLVVGECFHHCANPAPNNFELYKVVYYTKQLLVKNKSLLPCRGYGNNFDANLVPRVSPLSLPGT